MSCSKSEEWLLNFLTSWKTTKFLTRFSSRVYEAIKIISSQSICFIRKDFEPTKMQIKPKPTNKNTNKRTKNNKGNNLSRTKTSKRAKIDYFALCYILYPQNFFLKKNRLAWSCLDRLIYSTTTLVNILKQTIQQAFSKYFV